MSTNPIKGEHTLAFLSPPRKWRVTMNEEAICEAKLQIKHEKRTSFDQWLGSMGQWTTEDYRLFLWLGCHKYDNAVTEESLGEEMDGGSLLELKSFALEWLSARYPASAKKKLADAVERAVKDQGQVRMPTHGTSV